MTEENLKAKIKKLENELELKEQEVLKYLDKIEELEETLLKLENLISDENAKASKKKWKKASHGKIPFWMTPYNLILHSVE